MTNSRASLGLAAVAILAGAILDYVLIGRDQPQAGAAWLVTMLAMLAAIGGIGYAINGRVCGIVIDNRNRYSLSKLQMVGWTVLILSSLMVAGFVNVTLAGFAVALDIGVDQNLWALMGISTASFVAQPILLGMKTGKQAHEGEMRKAKVQLQQSKDENAENVSAVGQVLKRDQPSQATVLDLFQGDEVGNAGVVDISKVQQFFVSLFLLGAYGVGLWDMFVNTENGIARLPDLSNGFVYLLAISHGGYLIYKGTSHTKDAGSGDKPQS